MSGINRVPIVAMQMLARKLGTGGPGGKTEGWGVDAGVREQVWEQRYLFSFDHGGPALMALFGEAICSGSCPSLRSGSAAQSG